MIRALEFYSGIGGMHLALQRSGVEAQVIRAFDWDPAASQVYSQNWGKDLMERRDIARLEAVDLASLNASLWLLSPACQPYTVLNASAKGAVDPRAKSFLHLIQTVLPELSKMDAHPRWILVENVAGFEASSTRQTLLSSLKTLRYNTLEFLLTPLQFAIPNSRLRYYMLAKLEPLTFADVPLGDSIHPKRRIPGCGVAWVDPRHYPSSSVPVYQCHELSRFLDSSDKARDPNYWQAFAVPEKTLQKKDERAVLLEVRDFQAFNATMRNQFVVLQGYTHMIEGTSILQMNEALDTTKTFTAFAVTASSSIPEATAKSLQLLRDLQLRYFTPDELLRLFYFSSTAHDPSTDQRPEFSWPAGISIKTKYRLIGNSVNIKVVQELITYLFRGDLSTQ